MLHFLINKPNYVYIGVCDWGEAIIVWVYKGARYH